MTRDRDPRVYLEDILDAARKARQFLEGLTFEQLEADDKSGYAVVRALEIVGEAAKQVPSEIRDKSPGVPWRVMAGMPYKLIHAYSGVDLKVVWRTVYEELPSVVAQVEALLDEFESS